MGKVPPKGFKSITIKEKLYNKFKEKADKENKSVTKKATEVLRQDLEVPAE